MPTNSGRLRACSRKPSDWVILVVLDRREPRWHMIKTRTKPTPRKGKFAVGEHIRVVPLHQPTIAAPPKADLTYRGGALIPNIEVFTIFWGKLWGSWPASTDTMGKLNKLLGDRFV